jgi:antitoxin (DNA-binding transcriptional repressor) of toxin-antitoxin stability system
MAEIKTVGIKELKNNLSAYLRDVRRGIRVLVTDRAEVVAELHEPGATYAAGGELHPQLEAWVRAGDVTLPTRPKGRLPDPPAHLPDGTARRLLDADREDGSE